MSKRKFRNPNTGNKAHREQILLSISIMVSGREETMGKCIDSLERLRRRVPCELILTDTGCTAEVHEWLERKADKVLTFTWCNDFAAARNVGLQAASGQWFMFMDDDEWFEDTAQLEDFFLSGKYRQYQSASYIVRNYANMEGTIWRDTPLTRMTRIRQETRFFYPIHESLWPLLEPIMRLGDYAHHYGYASEDPEVQMAKRRRNLDILLPEIEKDPHCMKHYLQTVSEYLAVDDYEAAWKMAEQGIANCDPARPENVPHIYGLYAATVRMRLRAKHSAEAVRRGKEHLEGTALSDLARASVCGDLAIAYGELGEAGESLGYLREYLKWKDYFTEHEEKWLEQDTLILDSCFENFQYRKAMGWGFAAALALGDARAAEALLARDELEWWLDAVQGWYTLASEGSREKWQEDFQRLLARLEPQELPGQRFRTGSWEESGAPYSHIRQLYGILTMPEPQEGQEMETGASSGRESAQGSGQAAGPERESAKAMPSEGPDREGAPDSQEQAREAAAQMEVLAAQLKEKVKALIGQGQHQAALAVIGQLRGFFPGDMELLELQERCGQNAE